MYDKHYLKTLCIDFAIRIVQLKKYLDEQKNEHIMSKQILRSGTSIGSNVSESEMAQSTADFVSKLHIALKEANETSYWLEVLAKSYYISPNQYKSINDDLRRIIGFLVNMLKRIKGKRTADAL